MPSVVLKNTFWEVLSEEELVPMEPAARRRAKTEQVCSPQQEEPASEYVSAQACRLCTLLGEEAAAPRRSPSSECECAVASARGVAGDGPAGLKQAHSISSMATMVPPGCEALEDSDEGEPKAGGAWKAARAPLAGRDQHKLGFQHRSVPRHHDFAAEVHDAAAAAAAAAAPTTLMLRNIPNRYTQKELMEEIGLLGFGNGTYNFFYAPIDNGSMGNVGYSFINFIDAAWAGRFLRDLSGYTFLKHQQRNRTKIAKVSVAHLQGLEANVSHYEHTAVSHRGRSKRPLVMGRAAGRPGKA